MIHILVVDDDKKINQTVCAWLNDCGFEAKGVLSAAEAYDEMYNCHASNYSSHLLQLYRRLNPTSPLYHLS